MTAALEIPARVRLPASGELMVWWAPVPAGGLEPGARAELDTCLDAATRERIGRKVQPLDADRSRLAHALLRGLVGAALGVPPAAVRFATTCASCGSVEHGKPRVVPPGGAPADPAPVEVNLSHSGELVAVVLGPPGLPVGVDVETDRRVDWPALRRSVFDDDDWTATAAAADPDRARFDAWSRKEAILKATGDGLSIPLRSVPVTGPTLPDGGWRRLEVPAGEPGGGPRTALVLDLPQIPGGSAAVAVVVPAGFPTAWTPRVDVARG